MRVFLLHHSEAVGPDVDPQRPLSSAGLARAERLAERFAVAGFSAAAIWHSGKLRARQTAEPFLRRQPFAEFSTARGLRPDDPPEVIADVVRHEERDVILAGHMPNLAEVLRRLVPDAPAFPLHALVVLVRGDDAWAVESILSD